MNTAQKQFMTELINTPAPSGFEEPVQKLWFNEVAKFCKNIKKDIHGNIIATLNPGREKSLMLVGHSDEIGLIVNYINNDGFIFVRPIGGIDISILASHSARILTPKGIVKAAVGRISAHLLTPKDREKKQELHEIWLDIGAKNKKDALKYVSVGDPVVFGNDYSELQNDTAMARCWDNRIGIFVVAEVLRKISKIKSLNKTVHVVSSVQEETGVWGAGNVAYDLKPTAAVAVDVSPCTDQPEIAKERFGETKIGSGPVITRGVRSNNKMADELISISKKKKIPCQIDVDYGHTWTDADPISQVRGGIPIAVVSVATRYLHTSVETLSLKDVDMTIDLLAEYTIRANLLF